MKRLSTLWFGFLLAFAAGGATPLRERADRFLAVVNAGFQALYRVNSEAQWAAATDVKPVNDAASEAKALLAQRLELTEMQVQQLERALLNAAEGPMTDPDLVNRRITAETAQKSTLNGFQFRLRGSNVVANDLDRVLSKVTDLAER